MGFPDVARSGPARPSQRYAGRSRGRVPQVHATAPRPFSAISVSSFSDAPCGRFSPRGKIRRSAMERINARLDRSFNFETHYIRGLARMKTRVGLALSVLTVFDGGVLSAGGDDGDGARLGARRPRRSHALAGRRGALPRHRLSARPAPDSPDRTGRSPANPTPRPNRPPLHARPGRAGHIRALQADAARQKTPQRTCLGYLE